MEKISSNDPKYFLIFLKNYSFRLSMPIGLQSLTITNATDSCTAQAGSNSNVNNCASSSLLAGTSYTSAHEDTSVALLKFPITNFVTSNQKTLLKVNVASIIGNSSVTVMILGTLSSNVTWSATSASWSSLSNGGGPNILMPLSSGLVIVNITQNFVNWWSDSNVVIVGHLTGTYGQTNQERMIDVTDYVNEAIGAGCTTLTFFMYRPFRHPGYLTGGGNVSFDYMSYGSLIQLSSINSANPPQLLTYYNPSITTSTTTTTTTTPTTTTITTTTSTTTLATTTTHLTSTITTVITASTTTDTTTTSTTTTIITASTTTDTTTTRLTTTSITTTGIPASTTTVTTITTTTSTLQSTTFDNTTTAQANNTGNY